MSIGFLASIERKVDMVEFVSALAANMPMPNAEIVRGFKALVDSGFIKCLDDRFKMAAVALMDKGLVEPPMNLASLGNA